MFSRKVKHMSYDHKTQRPVIRASICTGEQVAGFKDIHTGRFEEIMVIRDGNDLNEFVKIYDISKTDITKEY